MNIWKLKFPYLYSILDLKRDIYTEEDGFIYDPNWDKYLSWLFMSKLYYGLFEYFETGNMKIYENFDDISHLFFNVHSQDEKHVTFILNDILKRKFEYINEILKSKNINLSEKELKSFNLMMYIVMLNDMNAIMFFEKDKHFDIDTIIIDDYVDYKFDDIVIEYEEFTAVKDEYIDSMVDYVNYIGIIFDIIFDSEEKKGLNVNELRNVIRSEIQNYM